MLTENRPALSVVVPMFNEEENVEHLYRRLETTLKEYGLSYELIFVEDGSSDGTFEKLMALHEQNSSVIVLRFARNFGQQMALWAGLRQSRGDVVVLIDADMQYSPEDIPRLVDRLSEGYEIVYGKRAERSDSWLRKKGSALLLRFFRNGSGVDFPDTMSCFAALDRRLVDKLLLFNEKNKFWGGLFAYLSDGRWATVPVEHAARQGGRTKYEHTRLLGLALYFVSCLTTRPLRLAFYAGAALVLVSILGAITWCVSAIVLYGAVPNAGTGLILAAMCLLSGVNLIAIGLLGEYVGNIQREVKDQPPYIVQEILKH